MDNVENMLLFRLNGEPMRFHLVDMDRDEAVALKELIEGEGGEVADDEESLVKFTSRDKALRKLYVRAKIYDVAFIVESLKAMRFVEPEKYRLGTKIPGDEFIMLHFLYGHCSSRCNNFEKLAMTRSSDSFAMTQSLHTCEGEFRPRERNAPVLKPPSYAERLHRVMSIFFDESQSVVDRLDLATIYKSSLANGHAFESVCADEEKRSCNLDCEVQPKIAVLVDGAKRSVRCAEKPSVEQSPRPQRSPRTSARKSVDEDDVGVEAEVRSNVEARRYFSSSSKNQNERLSDRSSIQMMENGAPEPPIEVIQIDELSDTCASPDPKTSKKKRAPKAVANDEASPKVVHRRATKSGETLSNLPMRTERKQTKKISDDGNLGNEEARGKKHAEKTSESENSTEMRPLANSPKKRKSPSPKTRPMREICFGRTYISSASSSSSSGGEPSKPKKSRKLISLSDSSDAGSDVQPQPCRSDEAGPSGIREKRQNDADNDESSGAKTHRNQHELRNGNVSKGKISRTQLPRGIRPSQKKHSQNKHSKPPRQSNSDETEKNDFGNERENGTDDDETSGEELQPNVEKPAKKTSRGKLWREKLLNRTNCNRNIQSGKPYTPPEKRKMLRYLIDERAIPMAKGLVIWTKMINDGHLTHRTPQSLQNHFVKYILTDIDSIDYISEKNKEMFRALKGEK